jgi:hypothetical protein
MSLPVQKFSTDATAHRRMVSVKKIDRVVARFSMSTGAPSIFHDIQKRHVSSRVFAFTIERCTLCAPRACWRLHRRAKARHMYISMCARRVAYTLP